MMWHLILHSVTKAMRITHCYRKWWHLSVGGRVGELLRDSHTRHPRVMHIDRWTLEAVVGWRHSSLLHVRHVGSPSVVRHRRVREGGRRPGEVRHNVDGWSCHGVWRGRRVANRDSRNKFLGEGIQ